MPLFSMTSLFPSPHDVYYRYYGSLTTPPCHESVIWTIFKSPISISKQQINLFRLLGNRHINKYRDIADNFRPLQALYGRNVFTNNIRGMPSKRGHKAMPRIVKITTRRYTFVKPRRIVSETSRRQSNLATSRKPVKPRRIVSETSRRQSNLATSRKPTIRQMFPNTSIITARNKKSLDKYINKLSKQLKTELLGVNGHGVLNGKQLRNRVKVNGKDYQIKSPVVALYGKQFIRIPYTNKKLLTKKFGIYRNNYMFHNSNKVQQKRKHQRVQGYQTL
ncbi:uncharacterized protein LOC127711298 [Mytilus californianus]|uniref:uncharacterized protein LOC127711298 n=1 Tax=Mytilus californianus TaxID=6549 RepID=UPI002245AAB6|nr:uncharacterized protein LOC127711298 [Mytilus californianus]